VKSELDMEILASEIIEKDSSNKNATTILKNAPLIFKNLVSFCKLLQNELFKHPQQRT
jgi:hypothetical protein